jgi:uncharacterized membrane protein
LIAGLRAIAILALCAASLVLAAWQIADGQAVSFAVDNMLAFATRTQLFKAALAGGVLVAAVAGAYVAFAGLRAVPKLRRISRIAAPLTLAAFVPALVYRDTREPWAIAIAIGAFVLVLERLLRVSLQEISTSGIADLAEPQSLPTRRARRAALVVVLGCIAFYAIYMSRYTIFSHRRFGTYNFDLGQYDNIFWSVLHGYGLRCSPLSNFEPWSELGNHAELSVFFLVPFYALRPNAETLLIMQACLLALGALPIYLFAARRLPPSYAAVLAICYLLYPPLHGSNFYDFHFQPIAATFVLFTIYFVDTRRWILAAIAFVIAIGCREDISVGLAILGLYFLLTGYRPGAGFAMAAAGVTYFVAIRFAIMPRFGTNWFSDIYKDLYPHPDGPRNYGGVVYTLATNPSYVFRSLLTQDKLRYFLQIAAPIAFLPLRRLYLWPALIQGTFFTLLTTAYSPTTDIGFQYSGHFTPYVFAASALALAAFRSDDGGAVRMRAAAGALCVATILCTIHWGAFPPNGTIKGGFVDVNFRHPSSSDEQKAHDLAELDAMVPPRAKVAVSEEELPHVSGRLNVLTLKYGTGAAEYVIYSPYSQGGGIGAQALSDGSFTEVATRPGLYLLKRKSKEQAAQ